MKRKFFFYLLLLLSVKSIAQKEHIKLPKLDFEVDTLTTQNFFPIFITDNHEIYFEDERLRFWDQIPAKLLELKREPILRAFNDIVIYADATVPYGFIQKLKEEIGRVWSGYFHYKIDSFECSKVLTFFNAGSFYNAHQRDDIDWVFNSKMIYTRDEKNQSAAVPRLEAYTWPVPAIWQNNFSRDFKNRDTVYINLTLKDIKYSTVKLNHSRTYITIDDETINWDESNKIENTLTEKDLIFLKTSYDLEHQDFIKMMGEIQNYRSYVKYSIHGILRKPFVIEIPYFFDPDLEENNIKY
jgi:biopolymer transport protein ExbD